MAQGMDKTFQLAVYVKAVHCVKWRIHVRFGMHFRTLVANFTDAVEFQLDDGLRDVLTGRWGRIVEEINQ